MLDELEAPIQSKWNPIINLPWFAPVCSQWEMDQTSSCKQLIWQHPQRSSENFLSCKKNWITHTFLDPTLICEAKAWQYLSKLVIRDLLQLSQFMVFMVLTKWRLRACLVLLKEGLNNASRGLTAFSWNFLKFGNLAKELKGGLNTGRNLETKVEFGAFRKKDLQFNLPNTAKELFN